MYQCLSGWVRCLPRAPAVPVVLQGPQPLPGIARLQVGLTRTILVVHPKINMVEGSIMRRPVTISLGHLLMMATTHTTAISATVTPNTIWTNLKPASVNQISMQFLNTLHVDLSNRHFVPATSSRNLAHIKPQSLVMRNRSLIFDNRKQPSLRWQAISPTFPPCLPSYLISPALNRPWLALHMIRYHREALAPLPRQLPACLRTLP